jgi:hypothetical protein
MKHSQALGKRARLERAVASSIKKWKRTRQLRALQRLQERDRLASLGIQACANCHCVEVLKEGLYCATCADGLH